MKIIYLTTLAALSTSVANAHPSMHHTGHEPLSHDLFSTLPFAGLTIVGLLALSYAFVKK